MFIFSILLSVLNVGLVVAPIGGAVGVLAGIDYHRRITGQEPLFWTSSGGDTGSDGGGSSSGGGGSTSGGNSTSSGNSTSGWDGNKPNATTTKGGITISEYCQQYNSVVVNTTTGQNYTLNPNQWGWNSSESGGLCLNVTTYNNETYSTNTTAPKWSATWEYPEGSSDQPVHAFPNIMIDGGVLPAKLGKLSVMNLDVKWAYLDGSTAVVGTVPTTSTKTATTKAATTKATTDTTAAAATTAASAASAGATSSSDSAAAADSATSAAAAADTTATTATTAKAAAASAATTKAAKRSVNDVTFSANVAVDMFFDSNATLSALTSNATYEVMVWLAQFGEYTDPIGITAGIVTSQVLDGVNFTLYYGTNDQEQHVLTWIAEDAAPAFNASILPLVTALSSLDLDYYPSDTDYLGYFAFGSETYYSVDSVTFDVEALSMDIW